MKQAAEALQSRAPARHIKLLGTTQAQKSLLNRIDTRIKHTCCICLDVYRVMGEHIRLLGTIEKQLKHWRQRTAPLMPETQTKPKKK